MEGSIESTAPLGQGENPKGSVDPIVTTKPKYSQESPFLTLLRDPL